jgi:glycosyltransferase involved in cell wall biosynthesis
MARFEPENNVHLTVEAFSRVSTDKKLVLIGGASYETDFVRTLTAAAGADPRVVLPGFVYDAAVVNELLANAFAYVHGNEAGGTNPGLLQAMGAGCAILARNVSFNREVCGGEADYFDDDAADLAEKIRRTLARPEDLARMKSGVRRIARERYDWEAVTEAYERLLLSSV